MSRKLKESLVKQKQQTEPYNQLIPGMLGIPLGGQRLVEVAGRNSYVYVRLRENLSEVIQAFNNRVAPSYNLPVLVERQGNRYVVIDVDTQRYDNNWGSYSPYLARHGNTHSFDIETGGGGDIVWVYPRQFMPLLALPSGSVGSPNVIVSPYTLRKENGTWMYVGNTGTASFAPYNPLVSGSAVMGLIVLNTDTGNPYFLIGSGTPMASSLTGSSQVYPYIPTLTNPLHIPVAAIRLISGTSRLTWDNIYDVRQFVHGHVTGSAGGLSSVAVRDEGVPQGNVTTFDFIGAPVSVSVSGSVAQITVSATASGSSSATFTGSANSVVLTDSSGNLNTPSWLKWGGSPGAQFVEFGADKIKESNAGKMGYEAFGAGFMFYVGAGSGSERRKHKFFDDVYVDSDLYVNGGQRIYADKQVDNGNSHDHVGGDGLQINHQTTLGAGTNTHAQIDGHLLTGTHAYSDLTGALTQAAGTYTPVLTGTTNVDATTVVAPFIYMRLGNFVTVAGALTVDPTAAANTVVAISLPIASNFTAATDGVGNGTSQLTNAAGNISSDATNDRVTLTFQSPGTANMAWRVVFMYEIK